ncbi:hypothetical protein AYI68_g3286 [Smittium mucronatum]|uniref:Uncharacterized protein n=1 Tax=Smittium mucronatum TaxID=133383 RepID=A0A1R0H0B9_9FUNG|nr:hypothetical protein AYI68_g5430 [Smittium mucronatum]OLY82591.1 hypothetical protein AYI68_g3286 [Smittium mucronatum]
MCWKKSFSLTVMRAICLPFSNFQNALPKIPPAMYPATPNSITQPLTTNVGSTPVPKSGKFESGIVPRYVAPDTMPTSVNGTAISRSAHRRLVRISKNVFHVM